MANKSPGNLTMGMSLNYGIANFGFMFMIQLSNMYVLIFLTDVQGLLPANAGIVTTISQIIGLVSVPILGPIIERSKMRWGKYRSWILWSPIAVFIFEVGLFTNFHFESQALAIVVCTICYAGQSTATNALYIAYTSLNSVLATNNKENVQLSTIRSQGGSLGKFAAGSLLLPIIYAFGVDGELTEKGFFAAAIIVSVIFLVLYENLFRCTKGVDDNATAKESAKVSEMFKIVTTSRPLIFMLLGEIARVITILLLNALFPYFFIYVVKDPSKTSVFFGATYLLAFFGAFLVPVLSKKISKKIVYSAGMLLFAVMMFAMYMMSNDPNIVIVLACIGYIGYSFGDTINTAILGDISDYIEYKTGTACRALVFSVYQLAVKIAAVVSSSIAAFGLAAIGYVAGTEPTEAVIAGIKNLSMFLPAALLVISAVCLFLYNIKEKEMPAIREELAKRRAAN